jgi:hypothetical protein
MLKQRELNASHTMASGHEEGDTRPGRKRTEKKITDIIFQTSWVNFFSHLDPLK